MNDLCYKFILIGPSGAGKTSILKKLINNTFTEKIPPTIGVEYMLRSFQIRNENVNIQIWDTAGQERYRSLSKSYYRNAVGVLIVFDITEQNSFDSLTTWISDVHQLCDPNCVMHLIGNKLDLANEREVSFTEASDFATAHNMKYIETSAKEGDNINEAFVRAIDELIERGVPKQKMVTSILETNPVEAKKQDSCFC